MPASHSRSIPSLARRDVLIGALLLLGAGAGSADEIDRSLNRLMENVQSSVVAVEAFRPEILAARPEGGEPAAEGKARPYRLVISSGVLLEGGQRVVTIASGVEGCDSVVIRLQSGHRIPATLHAKDPELNVALLEIEKPVDYPVSLAKGARLEDLLKRNAWVATLGYSSGRSDPLFTVGRITGLSYTRMGPRTMGMLRTTAPIFAGCSGGALVDLEGRWIGLLSGSCVLESEAGSATEGLLLSTRPYAALALPVDDVLDAVARLSSEGPIDVGFLGVRIPQDKQDSLQVSDGVRILEVIEHCPAHQAGLAEGDVILKIDGEDVSGPEGLRALMDGKRPGDSVVLEISRGGESRAVEVHLGSRARFENQMQAMERERIQEKQIREQIRVLQEMLTNMTRGLKPARTQPADASPPVEKTESESP